MRVLIIIPAFNEARSLPQVLESLRGVPYDLCVVDDGSTDGTAEVAAQASPRATILRCPFNLGIGGAVQTGLRWARLHGYDAAVQLDADGQHEARELSTLLTGLANADLVIGSRRLTGQGYQPAGTRLAGITLLCWLLSVRWKVRVTDPSSGFRAFGPNALALFAEEYPSDYPEPESIGLAIRAGLTVLEVPVVMHARTAGESSITWLRTLYYLIKVTLSILLLPTKNLESAK